MSKKQLNAENVLNELSGKSVFFQKEASSTASPKIQLPTKSASPKPADATIPPRNHDTKQPQHHDTVVSRYQDGTVEEIRKAVKIFGKEAATHRFTEDEKRAIIDIVFSYKQQGLRTSENEITRTAINFVLHDYRENGENSILHLVLSALNQ